MANHPSNDYPEFKYDSQPLIGKQIRLLQFHTQHREQKSFDHGLVSCKITLHDIGDTPQEGHSAYIALSYVWGDLERTRPILVDGGILHVTENLDIALRHLQFDDKMLVWIDAICSNQDDEEEKGQQVQRMADIYQRADRVLVWLCPGDKSTDCAMKQIDRIGKDAFDCGILKLKESDLKEWHNLGNDETTGAVKVKLDELLAKMANGYVDGTKFPILTFSSLTEGNWFTRAWVVQELAVARNAEFVCGNQRVCWEHFFAGFRFCCLWLWLEARLKSTGSTLNMLCQIYKLWRRNGTQFVQAVRLNRIPSPRAAATLATRKTYQIHHRTRELPEQLVKEPPKALSLKYHLTRSYASSYGNLVASDPRDRVYALLEISVDREELRITPIYMETWQNVYTKVAKALIRQGHIDILHLCRLRGSDLPSWVPDWRNLTQKPWGEYSEDGLFHAAGHSSVTQHSATSSDDVLILEGYQMDILNEIGSVCTLAFDKPFDYNIAGTLLREVEYFLYRSGDKHTLDERIGAMWRIPIGDKERGTMSLTQRATIASYYAYLELKRVVTSPKSANGYRGHNFSSYMSMMQSMHDSRPFLSASGYVGLCPSQAKPDDLIFIPLGAPVPLIIRGENGKYRLVGEAYVYGIMDGEFLSQDRQTELFELR